MTYLREVVVVAVSVVKVLIYGVRRDLLREVEHSVATLVGHGTDTERALGLTYLRSRGRQRLLSQREKIDSCLSSLFVLTRLAEEE